MGPRYPKWDPDKNLKPPATFLGVSQIDAHQNKNNFNEVLWLAIFGSIYETEHALDYFGLVWPGLGCLDR